MAENRNTINIKSDESGEIKVADEVVAIIAGLAAVSYTHLTLPTVLRISQREFRLR